MFATHSATDQPHCECALVLPRLSCCIAYLQQQQVLVRSTSVWLPRSQVHTTAFYFSPTKRAALHPLALLYASISNTCRCVPVSPVSVMACRVASLQVFGVRSLPSLYVPSISMILVSMFDFHCQCVDVMPQEDSRSSSGDSVRVLRPAASSSGMMSICLDD